MRNTIVVTLMILLLVLSVTLFNTLPAMITGNYSTFIITLFILLSIIIFARSMR